MIYFLREQKDSVSLAFRLSLIKTMLEDEALIFLDDSINDLDDSRRLEAIKLFKKFANNSQLIFHSIQWDKRTFWGGI